MSLGMIVAIKALMAMGLCVTRMEVSSTRLLRLTRLSMLTLRRLEPRKRSNLSVEPTGGMKTRSTESWIFLVSNIEALRHKIDGDQELDTELAEWERIA